MQNRWKFIAGIDVSKKTFDLTAGANAPDSEVSKRRFNNNLNGYDAMKKWLKKQCIDLTDVMFCLENTGIYHRLLVEYLISSRAFVWVETPVQIKWSLGIQRGKSDAADAGRIMTYAFRNQDKAQNYKQMDSSLQQISDYLALRSRLQQCLVTLRTPIKELKSIGLIEQAAALQQSCQQSIASVKNDIKALEKKIKDAIAEDDDLGAKYKIATSVTSVGFVLASYLLVYTHGFTRFTDAKKLATFAGIAPFGHTSGTSIRGKTKIHHMGNKDLKALLHMSAVSAIKNSPELRAYYVRKVSEGKHKMSVINVLRNKIIARVFSCINQQRMFSEDYQPKSLAQAS